MKNLTSIIFILLLISLILNSIFVLAQEHDVEVLALGPEMREVKSREIVIIPFRVSNTGSKTYEFIGKLNLPEGWLPITGEFPFKLDPGKSEVQLVSFFVPQTALAGSYEITYLVRDRAFPSISDRHSITVVVLPLAKLKVEILEVPEYVIAGEDYQSCFMIVNEGNIAITVGLEIESGNDYPASADVIKFQLIPAESRTAIVTVKTDAKIQRELRHRLELTARMLEPKYNTITTSACSWVKIIPRITAVEDPLHKIPVKVKLRGVMEEDEESKGGFQSEISGRGTLDEEGTKHIDFLFRGPDIQEKSIFGERDEYRLSYWTDKFELHLGDREYSLSPLTEMHRYGRGIEGKLNIGTFDLGGYYQESRWIEPAQEEVAAYLSYNIGEDQKVGVNYLEKKGDNPLDIWSLQALLEPMEDTYLELEYARGEKEDEQGSKSSDAYRIKSYGRYEEYGIYYWLEGIYAQPDYPGYYKDLSFISSGVSFPIYDNLRATVYGFHQRKNLDLDTNLPAPFEKNYQLGLNYRPAPGTMLSCEYREGYKRDCLSEPSFDYKEESLRLSIGHSFEKLSFNSSIEIGKTYDNLTDQLSDLSRYGISAIWQPTSGQRYSGYFQIGDFYNYTDEYQRSMSIGLSGYFKIGDRTSLNVKFQTNEQYNSYIQDIADISLTHQLSNNHDLSLRIRHNSSGNSSQDEETTVMLEYIIPLGVPVSRKMSVGGIKGQVYDIEDNGRGIADVILKCKGATAVTDKNGEFIFPSLKPGRYYLGLDKASIGMDRVAVPKTTMEVVVEGGKEIEVKLGVVRSASLSGKIMVYRPLNNNNFANGDANNGECYVIGDGNNDNGNSNHSGKEELIESYGLANIIVELTNGLETQRRITDKKGHFGFEELRPGKQTLKVYTDNLPRYHYLKEDTFEFELKPGDKKEILIKVLLKRRPIRIIEEGEILLEEDKN